MSIKRRVGIVGGGIVGITAGIELLRSGFDVTIHERDEPAQKASRWNSGVFATPSFVPMNNPEIIGKLPRLLLRKVPGFRLDPMVMHATIPWALRFLSQSRGRAFKQSVNALHELITMSLTAHEALLAEAKASDLMIRNGWIWVFETEKAFAGSALIRRYMTEYGVRFEEIGKAQLAELEPHLAPIFSRALWITDSAHATDPMLVSRAYLRLFRNMGGTIERSDIKRLFRENTKVGFADAQGVEHRPDETVIAAGPWSRALLGTIGIDLPMVCERGYLRRYDWAAGKTLSRPVYDVAGGLVASPRPDGLQISTGTELTTINARGSDIQIRNAERRARTFLPMGTLLHQQVGNRPSLPDGRPAIGPVSNVPGLWLNCGHQHIGFNTSAGSAKILAAQMQGKTVDGEVTAFLPDRFRA